MTIEEVILQRQINFNNCWPQELEVTTESYRLLLQRMAEHGLNQVLLPVPVRSDAAFASLSKEKELAKLFSAYLDHYHLLPLHPDLAFDCIWRSLEYTIKLYAKRAWNYGADKGIVDCFKKVAEEVVGSKCEKEAPLKEAFDALFGDMSVSLTNYLAARLFYSKPLSVAPQIALVRERAKVVLPEALLADIRQAYVLPDGSMDTKGVHDIGRRFARLVRGDDFEFGGHNHQPLDFSNRVYFVLSVVLYTSRCERFHGDVYSPFKSSVASLNRYYEYYYLTLCSELFFWCMMEKLIERERGLTPFVDFSSVKGSVVESLKRMNLVLTNK